MKRRILYFLGGLGVVLLIVSLSLNFYLFNLAQQYYLQVSDVRLNPLGLDAYPIVEPANSGVDVVFIGDSRIQDWPMPHVEG